MIRLATSLGDQGIEAFNREMAEHRGRAVRNAPYIPVIPAPMAEAALPSSFAEAAGRFRKTMDTQTSLTGRKKHARGKFPQNQ